MSVAENVALPIERWTKLPRPAIAAMARGKLRLVGLEAAEDKLPSELSGGMVKRAAIARAMALEPSLLFLDEPASGLDPVTAAELDALMVTLRRSLGVTVVLVTHDLGSIVGIVDRAVILDQAEKRIIGTGSPAELKESQDPRIHAFFARTVEPANVDKAEKS
jgi:phospholipid/cholesterol/gamma-HCH transport system ATP-binding protein